MFCSKCGKKLNNGDSFCGECGAAVIAQSNDRPRDIYYGNVPSAYDMIKKDNSYSNSHFRFPMMIVLIVILCTPFYKVYSIPALEYAVNIFMSGSTIDSSFSFWGWFKLVKLLKDEGGEVSAVLTVPIVIYLGVFLIAAFNFVKVLDHYSNTGYGDADFWTRSKVVLGYMLGDNIAMAVMVYLVNLSLNDGLAMPIGINFLNLSPVIYALIIACIVFLAFADTQLRQVIKEQNQKNSARNKELLKKEKQREVNSYVKKYDNEWVCMSCREVNPLSSSFCRSCGRYR